MSARKKTAMVLEPLQQLVGLQLGDVRLLNTYTWLYALGVTNTDNGGVRRE